jgi:tetratricopeptide (TPR) repeat protein
MLLTCGFDWVHVYLAMPIFGSRLYDICVDKGYIDNPKSQDFVATKSVIRAPGVDPVKLEAFAYEMQLRVNFVENHNMKIGRYDVPIDYLKNVVNKYPDHAFGHYFLAKCYHAMDSHKQAQEHLSQFAEICEHDDWWRDLAEKYGIQRAADATQIPLRASA